MNLYLYNTETKEKEEVKPHYGDAILMYTCGPTIYDFAHIGNFRTYVFEDLLRRTLQFFGHRVVQAMNITDIDDKTIRGAIGKKIPLKQYTDPFKKAFFEDLKSLSIEPVEYYPDATQYVPKMIEIIQKLLEKGHAYVSENGSVYFSIRSFPSYGRLSHLQLEDLKLNASGSNEADEYQKENVSDFVLWKAYDPLRDGEIFWQSPFGPGRPGWHIECSAMAIELLGQTIDIHCGGVDNMFPHHENEIAQSECFSGRLFAKHWVHVEHLLVDHKKMSKSLGNFYTLRDLIQKGYSGKEVRYLLLSTHYRTQLNFTFAGLDAARASLQRIGDFIHRLQTVETDVAAPFSLEKVDLDFKSALSDDLNISSALATLFDLIRAVNALIDKGQFSRSQAQETLKRLENYNRVLAVFPFEQEGEISSEVQELFQRREKARGEKNWPLSDRLRDEILSHGYIIEDSPSGARLKRKP